jgi:mRNA-degrading endonuclease RelE of RelBE toxin-antitoxin system
VTIYQSRSFEQKVKKLMKQEKEILDHEVRRITQDPSIGEEKKGDLSGVFVHKFKINTAQYLLAYRKIDQDLELVMIGLHENYYRDLKHYLKNRVTGF